MAEGYLNQENYQRQPWFAYPIFMGFHLDMWSVFGADDSRGRPPRGNHDGSGARRAWERVAFQG
jgi:hypothetical protein